MASHDLEAEVFHREIVKQEQEQLRRKLVAQHEEEIERLRRIIKEKEAEHNNVMVRMRWERAKEAAHHEEEIERLRWTEKMKMRREHAEEVRASVPWWLAGVGDILGEASVRLCAVRCVQD